MQNDDPDPEGWIALREAKKRSSARNRSAIYNISKKRGILDRVEIASHEGSCLLDGKYYYYAQKKAARVKGKTKMYTMRGFQHFLDVFLDKEFSENITRCNSGIGIPAHNKLL